MKTTVFLLALICLSSGCAWTGGQGHQGADYAGGSELERGTTGVSTGADAGAPGHITGSDALRH